MDEVLMMRRHLMGLLCLVFIAACGDTERSEDKALGFDRANMDESVSPREDFFRHVNGGWLARTDIPEDRARWGAFDELNKTAEDSLREIVREISVRQGIEQGSPDQMIRDLYLSFMDEDGINVVRWADRDSVARIEGAVSRPSLDWPLLAFRRDTSRTSRLILRNLRTGSARRIMKVKRRHDLGRPSLQRPRLAWHLTTRRVSRIYYMRLSRRPRILIQSRVSLVRDPALTDKRLLWTTTRSGRAYLRVRHLRTGSVRRIGRLRGRKTEYWTTALTGRTAYATRWSLATRRGTVYRHRF
jgi:hypothetical protein